MTRRELRACGSVRVSHGGGTVCGRREELKSRGCDQMQALSGPERHRNWPSEMPARSRTQLLLGIRTVLRSSEHRTQQEPHERCQRCELPLGSAVSPYLESVGTWAYELFWWDGVPSGMPVTVKDKLDSHVQRFRGPGKRKEHGDLPAALVLGAVEPG